MEFPSGTLLFFQGGKSAAFDQHEPEILGNALGLKNWVREGLVGGSLSIRVRGGGGLNVCQRNDPLKGDSPDVNIARNELHAACEITKKSKKATSSTGKN